MRHLIWLLLLLTSAISGRAEQVTMIDSLDAAVPPPHCMPTPAGDISGRLRAVIDDYERQGQFAGTILVARGEQLLLAEGWGAANREWDIANDVDTRFRLGSLTKAFTGVLVMQLVERGDLQVSDSIGRYIPGLPAAVAEDITIGHLLTHTSGLQEFYRVPNFQRLWLYEPPSIVELFTTVANQPLEFAPGERYAYRNIGYLGLGYIVEQVTGLSYERALREHVLEPSGMKDSGVEQSGEIVEKFASGYASSGSDWRKGSFLNPDLLQAAGGVYSTAEDLFQFSRALDTNTLLGPETQHRMLTPRVKERDDESDKRHYAFGWHIDELQLNENWGPLKIVEHGGDVTSFETLFTRVPSLNVLVVILYNHGETDQNAIRDDLIRVIAEADANCRSRLELNSK